VVTQEQDEERKAARESASTTQQQQSPQSGAAALDRGVTHSDLDNSGIVLVEVRARLCVCDCVCMIVTPHRCFSSTTRTNIHITHQQYQPDQLDKETKLGTGHCVLMHARALLLI
jgi:hypothetical protein